MAYGDLLLMHSLLLAVHAHPPGYPGLVAHIHPNGREYVPFFRDYFYTCCAEPTPRFQPLVLHFEENNMRGEI